MKRHDFVLRVKAPDNFSRKKVGSLLKFLVNAALSEAGNTPEDWDGPDQEAATLKIEVVASNPRN